MIAIGELKVSLNSLRTWFENLEYFVLINFFDSFAIVIHCDDYLLLHFIIVYKHTYFSILIGIWNSILYDVYSHLLKSIRISYHILWKKLISSSCGGVISNQIMIILSQIIGV